MLDACHSHSTFSCQGFWKPLITMHVRCYLFLDLSNKHWPQLLLNVMATIHQYMKFDFSHNLVYIFFLAHQLCSTLLTVYYIHTVIGPYCTLYFILFLSLPFTL